MKLRAYRIEGKPMFDALKVVQVRVQCTKTSLNFLSEVNKFMDEEKIYTAPGTGGRYGGGFMAMYFYEKDAAKLVAWLRERARDGISDPKNDPSEKDK